MMKAAVCSNGEKITSDYPGMRECITCTLCNDDLLQPRTLPCQHTFCYRCINAWGLKNFVSDEGCECPTCGKSFEKLKLSAISVDVKVLLLQQIVGISAVNDRHRSFTNTPLPNGQLVAAAGAHSSKTHKLNSHSLNKGGSVTKSVTLKDSRSEDQQLSSTEEELLNVRLENRTAQLHSAPPGGTSLDILFSQSEEKTRPSSKSTTNHKQEHKLNHKSNSVEETTEMSPIVDTSLEENEDEYAENDWTSSSEGDENGMSPDPHSHSNNSAAHQLEVFQEPFDDEKIDRGQFDKIFLKKLQIVKCVTIKGQKETKDPFVHDICLTREGNMFVVDINNNVVKCCDPEGLVIKKTPNKLGLKPIRICELYSGELLVVEMNEQRRSKLSILERSLLSKSAAIKGALKAKSIKNVCVVRQMPEDQQRFYCGDSQGYIHRINLKSIDTYHKFHTVLPRVFHLAAADSLIAANDGNFDGSTSKIVRIFDEDGQLQWSYSGTKQHPFLYHGDMVFHGDYLLICDFWAAKIHIVFVPNEVPATILDLQQELSLVFPSSISTTADHKLVLAAQKVNEKKCLIFTIEYLTDYVS